MRRCVIIEEDESVLMGDRRVGGTLGESEVALLLRLDGGFALLHLKASASKASVTIENIY